MNAIQQNHLYGMANNSNDRKLDVSRSFSRTYQTVTKQCLLLLHVSWRRCTCLRDVVCSISNRSLRAEIQTLLQAQLVNNATPCYPTS